MPAGRPSKYTPEMRDAAIAAAAKGVSREGIAKAIGIDVSTLYRWMEAHEELREAINKEDAGLEARCIAAIVEAIYNPKVINFAPAAWLLERKWPQQYAIAVHSRVAEEIQAFRASLLEKVKERPEVLDALKSAIAAAEAGRIDERGRKPNAPAH